MKSKFIFLFLCLVTGCNLFPYDDFRYAPPGLNTSTFIEYNLVSYSSSEIVYDLQVENIDTYNDIYYEPVDYHLEGTGTLQVLQIDGISTPRNPASANVILIDESGSYAELDPHNLRTKIINKFMEDLSPDNHMLGGFSSGGLLSEQPVAYAQPNFESGWSEQEFLFELPKLTGGNSSLYDAINSAIDKLSTRTETNKNIVVLIHANDAVSTSSISTLVNKINANSIHIFLIVLGQESTLPLLWDLANQTSGAIAYCPQDKHMVTVLNRLKRWIEGEIYVSKLRVSYKPSSGTIQSGDVYENRVKIIDPLSGYEYNPVYVKIKIP